MIDSQSLVGITGIAVCATALAIAGARAQEVPREQVGTSFEIRYGVVETVQVGKMDATASTARGAVIGGVVGLAAADHDDDLRGALKGAAAGALIAKLVAKHQENNAPNVYTYSVALVDGGESKIVSETGDIRQGDCVAVEYGQSANVRRVSNAYCDSDMEVARADAAVSAQAQQAAADCHAAKQVALQAKTEAEMDVALKKVRLFCES
jgi:hypothetical protein